MKMKMTVEKNCLSLTVAVFVVFAVFAAAVVVVVVVAIVVG